MVQNGHNIDLLIKKNFVNYTFKKGKKNLLEVFYNNFLKEIKKTFKKDNQITNIVNKLKISLKKDNKIILYETNLQIKHAIKLIVLANKDPQLRKFMKNLVKVQSNFPDDLSMNYKIKTYENIKEVFFSRKKNKLYKK